jgi:hypothetical protein
MERERQQRKLLTHSQRQRRREMVAEAAAIYMTAFQIPFLSRSPGKQSQMWVKHRAAAAAAAAQGALNIETFAILIHSILFILPRVSCMSNGCAQKKELFFHCEAASMQRAN